MAQNKILKDESTEDLELTKQYFFALLADIYVLLLLVLTGNKNSFPHLAITRILEKIWACRLIINLSVLKLFWCLKYSAIVSILLLE